MQVTEYSATIFSCLSQQRLGKYSKEGFEAIEIYKWDIALSEAIYPLLRIIEVSLRNRLHDAIRNLLEDNYWLINQNHHIFIKLDSYWTKKIAGHIYALKKKKKLDEGHLIAELTFGFWTALISGSFEHNNFLWPKLKSQVFPNSHGVTIDNIRKRFDKIRNLRNRIFHYRSIWHWKDLMQQHDMLIEAIFWIEPDLMRLIFPDRFKNIYKEFNLKLHHSFEMS